MWERRFRDRTEAGRLLGVELSRKYDGRPNALVLALPATGSTMRAAVRALRKMNAEEVIVAVPVAAAETCDEFRAEVDDIVCLQTPAMFRAVGQWYEDFSQTTDEEVHELLERTPEPKRAAR